MSPFAASKSCSIEIIFILLQHATCKKCSNGLFKSPQNKYVMSYTTKLIFFFRNLGFPGLTMMEEMRWTLLVFQHYLTNWIRFYCGEFLMVLIQFVAMESEKGIWWQIWNHSRLQGWFILFLTINTFYNRPLIKYGFL